MSRSGIDRSDVARAYAALLQQCRAPSLCNIRLQLGTGSYSTIQKILDTMQLQGRPSRTERRLMMANGRGRPKSTTHAQLNRPQFADTLSVG